jgi:hypothetical protein
MHEAVQNKRENQKQRPSTEEITKKVPQTQKADLIPIPKNP